MIIIIRFLYVILFVHICLTVAVAQALPYLPDAPPLPKINEVSIKAYLTRDIQGIFTYNYAITNGKNSIGDLTWFQIDISQPSGGLQLPTTGLSNSPDNMIGSVSQLVDAKPMVPVSFPAIPPEWDAGPAAMGTSFWGAMDYSFMLKPRTSLSGFMLQSWGIPTIRDFRADPWFAIEKYYPSVDSFESEEDSRTVGEQLEKDREVIAFKGRTLGPTAPPAELKPVEFITNLIKMKEEAYTLGWITSKGIEISLDQKLENIKKKLEQGNTGAAKNILNAFINEVEAQGCESYETECPKGKHLKPEAYALLKYNAEYLVENIK